MKIAAGLLALCWCGASYAFVQLSRLPKNGAKVDFIDKMMEFGGVDSVLSKGGSVLDVGCGIGGTSRHIAKNYNGNVKVTGISLSPNQVKRATEISAAAGLSSVTDFRVVDALNNSMPDNSFDVVWACESGEHMPDKKKYVDEMVRVLKPGGKLVIATWCQRDDSKIPFDAHERKMLDFLYSEWTHPYFVSIKKYEDLLHENGKMSAVSSSDWTSETLPSWRHSVLVGVRNPWPVIRRPWLWWKCLRDGITLERMHIAFSEGLMQYGMITATKKKTTRKKVPVI